MKQKIQTALRNFSNKSPALRLISIYLLTAVLWLLWGCAQCAADTAAKKSGRLQQMQLTVKDFQLVDITESDGGSLATRGADPQMIIDDVAVLSGTAGVRPVIRSFRAAVDYNGSEPREMCLYYTTRAGEDYSQDRRVFPQVLEDGIYLYTLPRTDIVSLRFDPCSPDEGKTVLLSFDSLILNGAADKPNYWLPAWNQWFCLILYPALAASCLSWIAAAVSRLRKKI